MLILAQHVSYQIYHIFEQLQCFRFQLHNNLFKHHIEMNNCVEIDQLWLFPCQYIHQSANTETTLLIAKYCFLNLFGRVICAATQTYFNRIRKGLQGRRQNIRLLA